MSTLPNLTTLEKAIGAYADLLGLDAAYDLAASCVPSDAPAVVLPLDHDPEPPAALPFSEWLRVEAAWFMSRAEEVSNELIALAIERIADAADRTGATGVRTLLEATALFSRFNPDAPPTRFEGHRGSILADAIDAEAETYLRKGIDAGNLVAWVLIELAGEVAYFQANTVVDFLERKTALDEYLEWEADLKAREDAQDKRWADEDASW